MEEMNMLMGYYELGISKTCTALKFSTDVKGTSIVFFKRYYLKNSILSEEFTIQDMMFACIFFALKVEENIISAEDFSLKLNSIKSKVDPNTIITNERILIRGLYIFF